MAYIPVAPSDEVNLQLEAGFFGSNEKKAY
jgi:hypothetical protein